MDVYDEPSYTLDSPDQANKMMQMVDNQIYAPIEMRPKEKEIKKSVKKDSEDTKENKKPLTKTPSITSQSVQALSNINNFEKKLKQNFEYNIEQLEDSDYEEDFINEEIDMLTDKDQIVKRYKIIQGKFREKLKQIKQLQKDHEETKRKHAGTMELISKETSTELKDKKLIELARKNQELSLRIEKYKLKEKEYESRLKQGTDVSISEKTKNVPQSGVANDKIFANAQNVANVPEEANFEEQLNETKKKLKSSENKIVEYRNKLQQVKEENSKLILLIKKEIGENLDIDRALKDKTYWKGRGEIIESLKGKIKQLETQINTISLNNSTTNANNIADSVLSGNEHNTSVLPTPSRTSNMIPFSEYKKEKEQNRLETERLKEELTKFSSDLSRINTRKNVLEKELKTQREELTEKIKILVDKSDNDEKLISALYQELAKRGHKLQNVFTENSPFNLEQEIQKLRIQLKEKDNYINNLNSILLPDSLSGEKQINHQSISQLISKMKDLEDENKKLRLSSDDGRIYETLAKENAKMRLKIKDLEDKLCSKF